MIKSFFSPRLYQSPSDLQAMYQVLQAGATANISAFYVHTGDLNWWLFYPPIGKDLFQHIAIWDDPAQPGRILGWMLVDPSWPSFDVFLQPELYGSPLATEMYTYAEEQAANQSEHGRDKPVNKLWVAETDSFQRAHLEQRGFQLAYWDTDFHYNLETPPPVPQIPDGYTLRLCQGPSEVSTRAAAQHRAFESQVPFEHYVERFIRFMHTEAYTAALDIVAVDPDGHIGAFCIVWIDHVTRSGHFEPVGTHPDFQRKGLGKAVMFNALRRLRDLNLQYASVCTPESNISATTLYQTVGFRPHNRLGLYRKKLL